MAATKEKAKRPETHTINERGTESLREAKFLFQMEFQGVKKTRENTFHGSKYANLEDILEAALPLANSLGMMVDHRTDLLDPVGEEETRTPILITALTHYPSGEQETSTLRLPQGENAQLTGAFMSYFRRYHATSMLGIAEEDDDGNATIRDQQGRKAAPITEKQHSEILDYIEATQTEMGDTDQEGTLLFHMHQVMSVDRIEDLTSRQASTILNMLKAKYKRMQESE